MNARTRQINHGGKDYEIHCQLFENINAYRTSVFQNGEIIYDTNSPASREVEDDTVAVHGKALTDVMVEFLEGEIRAGRQYL